MIEFISYDGKYPSLCLGTLVIKVNNEIYHLQNILSSGGEVYFAGNDYSDPVITKGKWEIDDTLFPEKLKPYIKEIKEIVNENVEFGCCGGCL